jgi:hypothetical protein
MIGEIMPIRPRDSRHTWERILRAYIKPRRPRRNPGEDALEPVEPKSPKPLSGGAAAALEFDE